MRRIQCLVIYERRRTNIYLNIFSFLPKNISFSSLTINFKAFILTWPSCPFICMSYALSILFYLHYNAKITSIILFEPSINYFQKNCSLYLKLDYGKQPHAFKRTSCPQSRRWMPQFIHDPMTSWRKEDTYYHVVCPRLGAIPPCLEFKCLQVCYDQLVAHVCSLVILFKVKPCKFWNILQNIYEGNEVAVLVWSSTLGVNHYCWLCNLIK